MDTYIKMATRIIEKQETIIGPVAIEQAKQVNHLQLDWNKRRVSIDGDGASVIDELVGKYKNLFGQTSVEVCKEAVSQYLVNIPPAKQPQSFA